MGIFAMEMLVGNYTIEVMVIKGLVVILSTIVSKMCMTCVMMIVVTIILIEVRIITIFSSFQAEVGDPARKRFR